MNTKTGFALFFFVSSSCAYAQRDTLYLDSLTGNYIIRYLAHFTFVADSMGMHPFDKDEPSDWGKKTIETDSMVAVVFEPATKINPSVNCTVTKDIEEGFYEYAYRIDNGLNSRQALNEFSVEFGRSVTVKNKTPADGWHNMRRQDFVGDHLGPSNKWYWWGDIGLLPGKGWIVGILSGNGLPAIVPVTFRGKTDILAFPDEGPGYPLDGEISAVHSFDADCVKRWSLGPVAVPQPFDHIVFLDSLISYRKQCVSLGWISNDSVARSLDGKLRILRRDVADRKYASAVVVLRSLLRELEVHRSRSVSEDAYALFKYNAEYLSDRLAEAE